METSPLKNFERSSTIKEHPLYVNLMELRSRLSEAIRDVLSSEVKLQEDNPEVLEIVCGIRELLCHCETCDITPKSYPQLQELNLRLLFVLLKRERFAQT